LIQAFLTPAITAISAVARIGSPGGRIGVSAKAVKNAAMKTSLFSLLLSRGQTKAKKAAAMVPSKP
jgi:hypothetical protein